MKIREAQDLRRGMRLDFFGWQGTVTDTEYLLADLDGVERFRVAFVMDRDDRERESICEDDSPWPCAD